MLPVDIQSNTSSLSTQQRLVLDEQCNAVNMISQANDHLDNKAMRLFQVSGFILFLAIALRLFGFSPDNDFMLLSTMVIIELLAFVGAFFFLAKIIVPATFPIPGLGSYWDDMFKQYISVSQEDCFNQILSDYLRAYELLRQLNKAKAENLRISGYLLLIQITGLLIILIEIDWLR